MNIENQIQVFALALEMLHCHKKECTETINQNDGIYLQIIFTFIGIF